MRYPEWNYRWQWQLSATPEQLWPFAANTDRFNRATGLPPVRRMAPVRPNARNRLRFSMLGLPVEWDEEPFEWVRPRRFGVVRRYHRGPVAEMRVRVELEQIDEGGTLLQYETWLRPRNPSGIAAIPVVVGQSSRRRFAKVFRQMDRLALGDPAGPLIPPSRIAFAPGGRERLAAVLGELGGHGFDQELIERLGSVLRTMDSLDVSRLRPYPLADGWGADRREVLELCLHATRAGLLDFQWELLCPLCRGVKAAVATLAGIPAGVHCDTCNIDVAANFERGVELTFRPSAAIRPVDAAEYCIGGPEVTPHVVAQQLLGPGERRDVGLALEPGHYRLRTLGTPGSQLFVASEGARDLVPVSVGSESWSPSETAIALDVRFALENADSEEHLVLLERTAWSDAAATPAEVIVISSFRDLFANDVLRTDQHISVESLTVLFTDLRGSTQLYRDIGDAPAFGRVLDHFDILREEIDAEGGSIVKTIGDAVMAVFTRPIGALRALLAAQARLAAAERHPLELRAGLHIGPCIAVALNGRLDYFGSVVNLAARLEKLSSGVDVVLSDRAHADPEIAALLREPGFCARPFTAALKGFEGEEHRLWSVWREPPLRPIP